MKGYINNINNFIVKNSLEFFYKMSDDASNYSSKFGFDNMQKDAFRHAYTSAYLAHLSSEGFSASLGYAYEIKGMIDRSNSLNDNRMDLYNNFKGVETYLELKNDIFNILKNSHLNTIDRIRNEPLFDKNGKQIADMFEKESIIAKEELDKADNDIKDMIAKAIKDKIDKGELIIDPKTDNRNINDSNADKGIFIETLRKLWNLIMEINDDTPTLDEAEKATSPIIIDMNGDGIHSGKLATGSGKAIHFDLDGNGFAEKTAWINTSDAFLVLDKNANGKIDNGNELFGNHTLDEQGNKSFADGYAALAAYDENKDGKIDAQDSIYAQLSLWQDKNQNGISEEGEIISLAEAGISSIDLHVQTLKERDANGNIITHRGSVRFADGREHIAEDVWFQINPAQTRYVGDVRLSPEQATELLSLPNVRAFGNVMDLRLAMSQDSELKTMVQAYLSADSEAQKDLLNPLIYRWTGSEGIDPHSRDPKKVYGHVLDARILVTLEHLTGKEFSGVWCWGEHDNNPHGKAAPILIEEFNKFANYTHAWLMLYSKAHQETALHFWQVMSRQSQNKDSGIDWKDFADHLQSLQAQDNSAEAKVAYRMMNDLFTYSSAYQNSLSDYLMEHSDEYGALFAAEGIIPGISGDEQNNTLKGTEKNDILYGKAGNDTLNGGSGNDVLDGGTGNDSLNGGVGNDTYVFSKGHGQDVIYDPHDNADDRIIFTDLKREEVIFRQEGYHLIMQSSETDSVKITNFFHSDAYKIEHFQFADQSFSLEDLMTKGLLIHGTEANDTFQYWRGKAEVYAGAGNDILHGADKDDVLYGEDGDDKLYGNGGNDRLYGGDGADYLYAGAGDDILSGGKGADRLHGGAGADVFVFDVADDAVDIIEDFNVQEDKIALSREVFSALGEQLKAEAFALGTQADTQKQRVLFDVKTGSLLYDADGSGVIAAQHVATLRGSALHALSHEHFEIV